MIRVNKSMIEDKIEELQECLNSIVALRNTDSEEILSISRRLDELILQYYQISLQR